MTMKDYKAGSFNKQYGYRSFNPNPINREGLVVQPSMMPYLYLHIIALSLKV